MSDQSRLFKEPPDQEFETFWKAYPRIRRRGKGAVRKSFAKARKVPSWPGMAGILEALERAGRSREWKEGYVPLPATWLNQERWLDEWPEDDPSHPSSRSASAAAKRVLR